ncbi:MULTISPECIES: hypothetical protein [Burkholderia]|uniref:hypothetical protein n=1 Tax=Burkholderia TaxID=32008 RepID=UPI001160D8E8|nr:MULTISPECIES: hypothetical protein [Burkholderia]
MATRGQHSLPEAKVASLHQGAQVAGFWADLVRVTSQREDAAAEEAHRNRIRITIPNILTVRNFLIPEKLTGDASRRYMQAVQPRHPHGILDGQNRRMKNLWPARVA